MIRMLAEHDVEAVAALFARIHPDHGWACEQALAAYFHDILFDNPWRHLDIPSWILEEDGRVYACYAVLPRPMRLNGRGIRAAVGCQFLVDPAQRDGLAWMQLAKACLGGPQDLTLADGASEASRRMWAAVGGMAPSLFSLHWTRPLRPARLALSLLERRRPNWRPLLRAMRPLGALADGVAMRLSPNRLAGAHAATSDEPLRPETVIELHPRVCRGTALSPSYELESLCWLLAHAALKRRHGTLRSRAVRDERGRMLGWFLYYVSRGGIAEVLQIGAPRESFDRVLCHLLGDAGREGAIAVHGRIDPRHIAELSNRHCWLRSEEPWTLIHSRRADVVAALTREQACLTRLDGEWWLRFRDR